PVFTDRTAWYVGPNLDIAAMERGALHLIGEHDFRSFCMAASAVGKPTCRNVEEISIASEEILGEPHQTNSCAADLIEGADDGICPFAQPYGILAARRAHPHQG
ncbi:hypothetical protein NE591_13880, partial [Adlercreutzia sp. DFI.6.23]|nr:hypothetical protein [Adlercreutzia sp. DFI.6.23]